MRAAAADQCAHAREQLRERERLDEIIIGAQLEPLHPVFDLVARREEQHRGLFALAAQLAQHLPAVGARQHHVQYDDGVLAGEREMPPIESVAGDIDHEAVLRQPLAQVIAGLDLVFHNQHSHESAHSVTSSPRASQPYENVIPGSGWARGAPATMLNTIG